jgi:hypothetical protein
MTSNSEYMKKWYAANKERFNAERRARFKYDAEYRARVLKWRDNYLEKVGGKDEVRRKARDVRREKYHSDAEYREKVLARARESSRAKYRGDAAFRERERQRVRDRYWKLKAQERQP